MFNRWQEDWSVLADPRVPRQPLDSLKYIPLSSNDARTYLTFGANLRARFESNDALSFGVGGTRVQNYVIIRSEAHAGVWVAGKWLAFVQLQSDPAPGKTIITPPDRNRLDLEQAFIRLVEPLGRGTLKLGLGRQQIAFDLQRFISVRDGPNVRQSYDALWGAYEVGPWQLVSFYTHPLETRDVRSFDDYSSGRFTYGGVRLERRIGGLGGEVSATLSHFKQDEVVFPSVAGNERRNVFDMRFVGEHSGFDWDVEAMGQTGHIANQRIRAWAFGSRAGFTIPNARGSPRLGMQVDAASGDEDPHDDTLGTFNPLFPNGYYLTLSGYTGFTNFIHVKPSVTVRPAPALTGSLAIAAQWRATTADAVYTQPDIPVAGTAGRPGAYTGTYVQLRVDWRATPNFAAAFEVVRFEVGDAIRDAGGRDGNYIGIEGKLGW